MLTSKEQSIIFLALLIIYIGVYTLRAPTPSEVASDAQWAGFFSITLGVFAILTVLMNQGVVGANQMNVFSVVAAASFIVSAFFYYKLIRVADKGNFKYLLYLQVAAHVGLLAVYFVDFNNVEKRFGTYRSPSYVDGTVTHAGQFGVSPRVPVRAR